MKTKMNKRRLFENSCGDKLEIGFVENEICNIFLLHSAVATLNSCSVKYNENNVWSPRGVGCFNALMLEVMKELIITVPYFLQEVL